MGQGECCTSEINGAHQLVAARPRRALFGGVPEDEGLILGGYSQDEGDSGASVVEPALFTE